MSRKYPKRRRKSRRHSGQQTRETRPLVEIELSSEEVAYVDELLEKAGFPKLSGDEDRLMSPAERDLFANKIEELLDECLEGINKICEQNGLPPSEFAFQRDELDAPTSEVRDEDLEEDFDEVEKILRQIEQDFEEGFDELEKILRQIEQDRKLHRQAVNCQYSVHSRDQNFGQSLQK